LKKSLFFIASILVLKFAYSQWDRGGSLDYDDEIITIEDLGASIFAGLCMVVIGFIIMQLKPIKVLGKIMIGLGALLAVGRIFLYLLQIIGSILSVALKAAIAIGAILMIIWLMRSIYEWIKKGFS